MTSVPIYGLLEQVSENASRRDWMHLGVGGVALVTLSAVAALAFATAPAAAAVGDVTVFTTGFGAGAANGIVTGPDGNLWFTKDSSPDQIGRLTPAGQYTYFGDNTTIQPQADPYGITLGADGNLWFTELGRGDVGRITPTGTITEFELTDDPVTMTGIESGPDGNLWIAENFSEMIGRLPTTGSPLTEFGAGLTLGGRPMEIATGPDGNLWFNEGFATKIGKINPAGVITEYSSGTHVAEDVAAGPDGNIWFTQQSNSTMDLGGIGRIATDGTGLMEFNAGLTSNGYGSGLHSIVAGPNGNLWFTAQITAKIGRITPTGTITEFPVGVPGAAPTAITVGPDNNIWFTTNLGIGRVLTGAGTPDPTDPTGPTDPTTQTLTVTLAGNGSGTVSGDQINCPSTCSATVPTGTQVTLNAAPAGGSTFAGWAGACSGTGSCTTTVNGPTAVAADFFSNKVEPGAITGPRKVKVRNGAIKIEIYFGGSGPIQGYISFSGSAGKVGLKRAAKK